jgi:hypothetical protein
MRLCLFDDGFLAQYAHLTCAMSFGAMSLVRPLSIVVATALPIIRLLSQILLSTRCTLVRSTMLTAPD